MPTPNDAKSDTPAPAEGADDGGRAADLREAMIAELRSMDAIRSEKVEQAVRAVARHRFIPEAPLEQAYAAEHAVVTKRDERGIALSSVSAARIQAFMLEQADIHPGMRVLEIGSGGLNAAMIAELVGETGQVTTLDIAPEVIDRADRLLKSNGYGWVSAVVADGMQGEPGRAPYDRIVITVEATELAGAWVDQLTEDGRIVVPLRARGVTRSVAFHREGPQLISRDYEVCGFVPMQGTGARQQRLVVLHEVDEEQVGLRVDNSTQHMDPERLREALSQPRAEAWSELTMGAGESYEDLVLWLATTLPRYALLTATRQARDRGVVDSWSSAGVSAVLDESGESFAYLAIRPTSAERTLFEFGAVGHGPRAQETADLLSQEIRTWNREHRQQRAEFRAFPTMTPSSELPPGLVLDGQSFRITISWPSTAS